ncbi:hypothetical protein AAMO2058_000091900 [Amorphochlora amoebiformis]
MSSDTKSYRELKTLEERIDESSRIRAKYPDRVPVICERCNKSRSLAALEKNKFLVPADLTIGQFQFVVRKRLDITPEKAMFLFCGGKPAVGSKSMAMLYKNNKDKDGFLYITYAGENTYG